MINPRAYDELIETVEKLMWQARALGLFRTVGRLHSALTEARGERWEAQPKADLRIEFSIGPIREQKST